MTVKESTIEELTADIVDWADEVFPERDPSSALLKLFEEVGELVRDPSSPGEYADICIMLFDLANMHGIHLSSAIKEKMEVNRNRQWSVTSTGTLQHIPNMPIADRTTVADEDVMVIPKIAMVFAGLIFMMFIGFLIVLVTNK